MSDNISKLLLLSRDKGINELMKYYSTLWKYQLTACMVSVSKGFNKVKLYMRVHDSNF